MPPIPEEPPCWPPTLMPLKVRGGINRKCEGHRTKSGQRGSSERGGAKIWEGSRAIQ